MQLFPRLGWIVASFYLVCGALRLARFNCIAATNTSAANKEFKGFPIPAAAGLIASLTLFMLWLRVDQRSLGNWKWVLPPLMIFLSFMMFSGFRYPSFKSINWRTTRSLPRFLLIIVMLTITVLFYEWMPAVIFITYLVYGFIRSVDLAALAARIEEEIGDEEEDSEARAEDGKSLRPRTFDRTRLPLSRKISLVSSPPVGSSFAMPNKPVVLLIRDGWGINPERARRRGNERRRHAPGAHALSRTTLRQNIRGRP